LHEILAQGRNREPRRLAVTGELDRFDGYRVGAGFAGAIGRVDLAASALLTGPWIGPLGDRVVGGVDGGGRVEWFVEPKFECSSGGIGGDGQVERRGSVAHAMERAPVAPVTD